MDKNTTQTDTDENPIVDAVADERAGEDEIEEELEDLLDEDLTPTRPRVELVPITMPGGKRKRVAVLRLSGDEAIDAINDAADTVKGDNRKSKDRVKDVIHMKLKRCLVDPKDHTKPRFTDVTLRKFRAECESELLMALLTAVQTVNPVLKQA